MYTVFYQVQRSLFYIGNDAEIFPVHYTWKVAEKGCKMAFMMNKIAMILQSCEIILEKQKYFFYKNHCEIQVRTILVCALYLIKYDTEKYFFLRFFEKKSFFVLCRCL